jgi:hypothetical protein
VFVIVSKSNKRYRVLVDSDRAHAESVLADLIDDEATPSDLRLKKVWRG